jgi:hypothetical protein
MLRLMKKQIRLDGSQFSSIPWFNVLVQKSSLVAAKGPMAFARPNRDNVRAGSAHHARPIA